MRESHGGVYYLCVTFIESAVVVGWICLWRNNNSFSVVAGYYYGVFVGLCWKSVGSQS